MPYSNEQVDLLLKLGARVQAIRQSKGLSLQDLADLIEKEKQSIHRLEKGKINVSYLFLTEVARGLGVNVCLLLSDDPLPKITH